MNLGKIKSVSFTYMVMYQVMLRKFECKRFFGIRIIYKILSYIVLVAFAGFAKHSNIINT